MNRKKLRIFLINLLCFLILYDIKKRTIHEKEKN